MVATKSLAHKEQSVPGEAKFPPHVEMILSAIETGEFARRERREAGRTPYRTEASLRLFSDADNTPPSTIYTRDANEKGLGFITAHRLPLGYGGIVELQTPDGKFHNIQCTLLRCREAAPGWFEGSLYFNRPQSAFGPPAEQTTPTAKTRQVNPRKRSLQK